MGALPVIRQELSLIRAPNGDDGSPRWFLFDPVRNAFHLLTRQAVDILAEWRPQRNGGISICPKTNRKPASRRP